MHCVQMAVLSRVRDSNTVLKRLSRQGALAEGAYATAFSSDGRQPEVDFLHHWAVVWLKLSGKSSLKEKRKLAVKI